MKKNYNLVSRFCCCCSCFSWPWSVFFFNFLKIYIDIFFFANGALSHSLTGRQSSKSRRDEVAVQGVPWRAFVLVIAVAHIRFPSILQFRPRKIFPVFFIRVLPDRWEEGGG